MLHIDTIDINDSNAEPESELEEPVKKTKARSQAYKYSTVTNQDDAQTKSSVKKKGKGAVRGEVEDLAKVLRGGRKGKEMAMG